MLVGDGKLARLARLANIRAPSLLNEGSRRAPCGCELSLCWQHG